MKKFSLLPSALCLMATLVAARGSLIDGLVSYWPMDVTDGTSTPDMSFSNTMTGPPTQTVVSTTNVSGFFSNAMVFNGTTYLTNLHGSDGSVTGLPTYRVGASYTISMWVKGAAQTAKYLYAEGNSANTGPLFILQTGNVGANNTKLDVIIRNDPGSVFLNHIVSTTPVFNNIWHHIVWVDDKGTVKLYIDGVVDAANFSYVPSGGITLNTTSLGSLVRTTISTGNVFNGQMDEVAVWERALSAAEVSQVKTGGVYGPGAVVPARPAILTSSPANMTKNLGDWALFSATVINNRPFTYQWFKNGTAIAAATSRTYQATGLTTNNTGDYYSLAVTNPGGFVITTNATLTVLDDPTPNVTNALVDYWPLDVTNAVNGDLVSPELHFGHNMVLKGFVNNNELVPGEYGNALTFDFVTTYGYRTNGTPIYNRTNYSVSMWVKADFTGQTDRRVYSEGSSSSGNPLFTLGTDITGTSPAASVLVRTDGNLTTEVGGKKSSRPVFDNTWHQLVWTDANGKGKLYVDGTLDETDFNYTRGALTLNISSIGAVLRAAPGNFFSGLIDDVATYGRVLTWSEIQVLRTNGVPVPQGVVAPTMVTQPPDRTNGVFTGDTVSFPTTVGGSLPIDYQWRRNGAGISGVANPSAITDTLILTNVQSSDNNTLYSLVATNLGGSITSSVVKLIVTPWSPITNGEALKLDMGLTGSPNAQPGWDEMFALGTNPAVFANALKVTLSGIGTSMAERNRTVAPFVTNNPPFFTQAAIYNDFVFANATTDGAGLRVALERLAPNTPYGVTICSFDPQSPGSRNSDWTETASGTSLPITTGYAFDGSVQPTTDYANTLGGLLTSTADGRLQIEARRNGGTSFGVFLNGIRLVARPTATKILRSELVGGNIRVEVLGEYPGQPISIYQSTNLVNWTDTATPAVVTQGPNAVFEFPASENQMFYRSLSYPTW
jgi:hypothetical protein